MVRLKQGAGPSGITNLFVAIHLLPCRMQRNLVGVNRASIIPALAALRPNAAGDPRRRGLGLRKVNIQPLAQKFLNAGSLDLFTAMNRKAASSEMRIQ